MRSAGKGTVLALKLVTLGVFSVLARSAMAVSCGDVITTSAVLSADLSCPGNNPALTIDGGSLDMQGHEISDCLGDGILLIGQGGSIKNGSIVGCAIGVRFEGDGRHRATAIAVRSGGGKGFRATSDGNRLTRCAAVGNTSDGFDLPGNRNKIDASSANLNGSQGFRLGGERNSVDRCEAVSNGASGFSVGGAAHKLTRNQAIDNSGAGFAVAGNDHKISDNHGDHNTDDGFILVGDGHTVTKNVATGNGDGDSDPGFNVSGSNHNLVKNVAVANTEGFRVQGSGQRLRQCDAAGNTESGFRAMGATGFRIEHGRAHGNGINGFLVELGAVAGTLRSNIAVGNATFDARDLNANCGGNDWTLNTFGVANPSCID